MLCHGMFLKMPPEIYATSARRGVLDSFVLSSDKGPSLMGVTENQPIKSHRLSAGSVLVGTKAVLHYQKINIIFNLVHVDNIYFSLCFFLLFDYHFYHLK